MTEPMRVARLSVTAVKGLALRHPAAVEVTADGARGDRAFYLLGEQGKHVSCTKIGALLPVSAAYDEDTGVLTVSRGPEVLRSATTPTREDVVTDFYGLRTVPGQVVADDAWHALFTEVAGVPVRLVRAAGSAYDVTPVTLLGQESVHELERQAGLPSVDARRFRMLIELSGGSAHREDTWEGRRLRIGEVELRGGGPVQRCAATTRNPENGGVDLQTLRMISDYRGRQPSIFGLGSNFGVYADVVVPGTIRQGDVVETL